MYNATHVAYLLGEPKTKDVVNELIVLNYGLLNKQLSKFHLLNDPDALSYGYEALYNAILTYNSDRPNKFSTYASVCIYNKLGSYVRTLRAQKNNNIISYEIPVGIGTLADLLESDIVIDDDLMVSSIHSTLARCYHTLTNSLFKQIIKLWILSEFTMTQVHIADKLGCSQTYVSQVLKQFKYKLEVMLRE